MRLGSIVFVVLLGWLSATVALGQPDTGAIEDRNLDEVLASGFIEIAVYRDFPPYSFTSDAGEAQGIDIEVGTLIAEGLGVKPVWFWLTPDENLEGDLRNAIWRGSVFDRSVADVMLRVPYDREYAYAIDGYGLPKHEHVVMFGPYHRESWSIARDLEKTGEVRNLAIFAYEKVGVEIASLPDIILSGAYGGRLRDNVTHYLKIGEALAGLRAGETAAVVGMRSQIEWGLRDVPNAFDIDTDGLEQLAVLEWDIGAAVKQNHRELSYAIGDLLSAAVMDGRMATLFSKYQTTFTVPSTYDVPQ